jgi:hypothetical protein
MKIVLRHKKREGGDRAAFGSLGFSLVDVLGGGMFYRQIIDRSSHFDILSVCMVVVVEMSFPFG